MKTLLLSVLCAGLAAAQDAPAEFEALPRSRFPELPGSCVLLLVADPNSATMLDGRSSWPDAYAVVSDGSSYRWAWVPEPKAEGTRFKVPGGELIVLRNYGIAREKNVKGLGVTAAATLIEAEINGGRGAAEGADSVALTRIRILDGTPECPLKAGDAVAAFRKQHEARLQEKSAEIDRLLEEGRQASVGREKATGPRETRTLTFLTWNTKEHRLELRFRTRISDGRYSTGSGVPAPEGARSKGRFGEEWAVEFESGGIAEQSGKLAAPSWGALKTSRRVLPPPQTAPGPR